MIRKISPLAWPVWLLMILLWYGVGLNVYNSLPMMQNRVSAENMPLTPDIAFSWLQVLVNGLMGLVMTGSLLALLKLDRHMSLRLPFHFGPMRVLGLLTVLAFSLPVWLNIAWIVVQPMRWGQLVHVANVRHVIMALLVPYAGMLCLWRLWNARRIRQAPPAAPTVFMNDAPIEWRQD